MRISPQQLEYAGEVDNAITLCEQSSSANTLGLAIRHAADLVGFFLLKRGTDAPHWASEQAAVVSTSINGGC